MVSMACDAGGRAQVSADCQRFMVNALFILRELVGRDLVFLHARFVGMAASARSGDVHRIHRGPRVAWRPDIVHRMAIHANCDFAIAAGQPFTMDAGVVLAELVRAKTWIVLTHHGRIGMAASA